METKIVKAESEDELKSVFDYNIDAFSDSPDFSWTLDEIQHEQDEGWEIYSVYVEKEIIAALFLKIEGDALLTKNTAIKQNFQGSGHSHEIKAFFEDYARKNSLAKIKHYCRVDNFRIYSLNEKHGYIKTKRKMTDQYIVEWEKKVSKK